MSWGEKLRIETPEQIDFNLDVAGPGSRFYAQVHDWIVKWLVIGLLFLASLPVTFALHDLSDTLTYALFAAAGAIAFTFFFGYDIYFEGCRNGQTPGKRTAGLRVVRDNGGPIDVQAACIRNLIGLADFLPLLYLLGGLISLTNAKGQRLGDMAAGTVVIRERTQDAVDDLKPQILAYAGSEFAFGPEHLANCTANDQHILHSFFARAEEMNPHARHELADKLCATFLQRTGYQPLTPIDDQSRAFAFLCALYRDLEALRRNS